MVQDRLIISMRISLVAIGVGHIHSFIHSILFQALGP